MTTSTVPDSERLAYGLREAGTRLGVSYDTVRTWVKLGKVPVVKVGGRVLIPAWWLRERLDSPSPREHAGEGARRG